MAHRVIWLRRGILSLPVHGGLWQAARATSFRIQRSCVDGTVIGSLVANF